MVVLQGLKSKFEAVKGEIDPANVTGIQFREYEHRDHVMVVNLGADTVACDLRGINSLNNLAFINACRPETPVTVTNAQGKNILEVPLLCCDIRAV